MGNGDRTLEKRRRSGWVRWRKPRYPGRSSAVNRDEEGVGPGPGPVVQLLPVDFFYFCFMTSGRARAIARKCRHKIKDTEMYTRHCIRMHNME